MDEMPSDEDRRVGSLQVLIPVLNEPDLESQLPLCPDWPDLN